MFSSNDINLSVLRIRDVSTDPGSKILSFPDPDPATKEEGKQICFIPFFVPTDFTIENYFLFELAEKKRNELTKNSSRYFLLKKLSLSSENYGLGSGIRKKSVPNPGSRGPKGTGSGSATIPLKKN